MVLPIYLYGSEVLRQKAVPADLAEKEKIAKLVADMEETADSPRRRWGRASES